MFSIPSGPTAPGSIIRFLYPTVNEVGGRSRFRQRCVLVRDVRDTLIHPVSPIAFQNNPFIKRGRWLITGLDMDIGEERSFYWESTQGHQCATYLRLGLYNTLDPPETPVQWIGWRFAPTRSDRLWLADIVRRYNLESESEGDLDNLGIFPVVD